MKRLFLLSLLLAQTAVAQIDTPRVMARVEPDSVFIGDRFDYVIEIEKDLVQVVEFPEFIAPPSGAVELIEECPVDTLLQEGRRLQLRKRYRLAAFEEGILNMGVGGVLFADKNILDTLYARDSVYLKVATFAIDSTSQSIYDLKGQRTLPFKLAEVKGYLGWGSLVVLLLAALVWGLLRYLKERGKHLRDLVRPTPPEPPHIVAIKALEALHHQKLWQNNRHKDYYSGITDILRRYMADRYDFGAMEMTTDEIVSATSAIDMPQKSRSDLYEILRTADLVKFAKAVPDEQYNERAYLDAYYFVEETKAVEVIETESDETKKRIDD